MTVHVTSSVFLIVVYLGNVTLVPLADDSHLLNVRKCCMTGRCRVNRDAAANVRTCLIPSTTKDCLGHIVEECTSSTALEHTFSLTEL